MNTTYFYKDKPLFGLDIGHSTIKVMQISGQGKKHVVTGYGTTTFKPEAIKDGVIIDHAQIAKAIHDLFNKGLVGEITTRRVAIALPAARTYARSIVLPAMDPKDLEEAVQMEAEQYIPVPINDLYLDYEVSTKSEKETDVLAVAISKKIIDSYMELSKIIGLEPVVMETTIAAASRLFTQAEQSKVPTILIDFGSKSADITIYDKSLIVTGTVPCGGDNFTDLIAGKLSVTREEAHIIKTKYGLGLSKKQKEITEALDPVLSQLIKEIKRMIRYYEERFGSSSTKIAQVVTMGGGANMPGLSEYMTNLLRLPVRMCDPWQNIGFAKLQPPHSLEKSMYVTVSGLSLINPAEVFKS